MFLVRDLVKIPVKRRAEAQGKSLDIPIWEGERSTSEHYNLFYSTRSTQAQRTADKYIAIEVKFGMESSLAMASSESAAAQRPAYPAPSNGPPGTNPMPPNQQAGHPSFRRFVVVRIRL
jgi:hypothetical protein